jgi:hypothetical protein
MTCGLAEQHHQQEQFVPREERLRQERMATYSAFAGALTEHLRAVANFWFRRQENPTVRSTGLRGPSYLKCRDHGLGGPAG